MKKIIFTNKLSLVSLLKKGTVFAALLLCLSLTACGPSEEKLAQVQQKYSDLKAAHNEVVEAHKLVADASLDETLVALQEAVTSFETHNLYEMEEEELDALITSMDEMIASYEEYETQLAEIKAAEEAAVLVTIPVTLFNETSFTFNSLSLYEQGEIGTPANTIEELSGMTPSQIVTGLMIYRDVDNTPWLLTLTDSEGVEWELPISVEAYTEEGVSLYLDYDSENAAMMVKETSKYAVETETATDGTENATEEGESATADAANNSKTDTPATEAAKSES